MRPELQPRPNLLGVGGWFWGGNYKIERYLYVLHRVTGLGILLFVFFHLIETTVFRIQGQSVWQTTINILEKPYFEVGLILVSFAFAIHALNGLRLILMEFGFLLGKPRRPVYPYRDALRKKRGFTLAFGILIIILMLVFLLNRFVGAG
jgi:succinate dehydrogenase / fumarate reductase, cytochrome b subunit